MGACCTRNDAVPESLTRRNTEPCIKQPLLDDAKVQTTEGDLIEFETSTVISYILQLDSSALKEAWQKTDTKNKWELQIDPDLNTLFLHLFNDYIVQKEGRDLSEHEFKSAQKLAVDLSKHFQSILTNYKYNAGNKITKDFYLTYLQKYLADPIPGININQFIQKQKKHNFITIDPNEVEEMSVAMSPSMDEQTNIDEESFMSNTIDHEQEQEQNSLHSVHSNSAHSELQKQASTSKHMSSQDDIDHGDKEESNHSEPNQDEINHETEDKLNEIFEPGQQRQSDVDEHSQSNDSNNNNEENNNPLPVISIDDSPRTELHEIIETPMPDSFEAPQQSMFDMLQFISTSPTIRPQPDFDALHTVNLINRAMSDENKKKRGDAIGNILASLSESQRVEVRSNFIGQNEESLQSMLEDNFSGDLLLILTQLSRSNAYNDAEWIEKCRNKINVNIDVINEILMSRTNSQLNDLKKAYKERFGRTLLQSLLSSFSAFTYSTLLKQVLTDNPTILRTEIPPKSVNMQIIKDDAKILFHSLETNKKVNKIKVIELICNRAWTHLAELCKEYAKMSNFDLKTMIEKKFGKNSKSGDALQKTLDVARNRHSFFAQLLFHSMKGMSTDDDALIRIIVGRSGIDLGEIAAAFSQKYGNKKTLLQFIRSNARKGTFRNILLRMCAIGDDINFDDEDEEESYTNNQNIENEDDCKVTEPSSTYSMSVAPIYVTKQAIEDEKMQIRQTWNEYICCAPTVHENEMFDANKAAQDLIAVMADKKQKKNAKKLLIQTLTRINNKQRQELKKTFYELHPSKMELAEATQSTLRKGKTMIVMLGLLQRPAEFHCFWMKQAIKSKKIELLMEILCSCSNYELVQMKEFYAKSEQTDLLADIEKNIIGNKKSAKYLISKILDGARPESQVADKKLCKVHMQTIKELLTAKKNQKECKQFFGKLFVENSYAQIRAEINKFNASSEQTFRSIIKKIMGKKTHSAVIVEHIMKISVDRFGYFAEKLRDSMKGMKTSEHIMIRILVGRSEKDLGDIVQCFAEENYGEGKTLKQWMDNAFKGSFKTSLLEIAGAIPRDDEAYNDTDFASYTDSEMEYSLYLPRKVTLEHVNTAPPPSASTPKSEQKNYAMIVSSPEEVNEEIQRQQTGGPYKAAQEAEEEDVYDPYDIDEEEFGIFIVEKINDKTAQRLMQHLKSGSNKRKDKQDESEYEDDVIKSHQCIHVMLFACVLYLKYVEKTENKPEIQIDKKKLKKALMPSFDWMMENKLKEKQTIQKSNYKILGEWLQEFGKLKE